MKTTVRGFMLQSRQAVHGSRPESGPSAPRAADCGLPRIWGHFGQVQRFDAIAELSKHLWKQ